MFELLKLAVWNNSGVCYSTAVFDDKALAERFGAAVRAEGRTANGGWLDGMPLGRVMPSGDGRWSVEY